MNQKQRIMVTGGAGFIGSAVCRYLIQEGSYSVLNVDKLTYAGNLSSLDMIGNSSDYQFEKIDICDGVGISDAISKFQPNAIMHLAAESHVDRSIDDPSGFIETNVVGTTKMLYAALAYWTGLTGDEKSTFRFHHISTDEVYGDLPFDDSLFHENTSYDPSSPYSASKAASDHFVRAWGRTYGLPVVISNCSNNYGPFHFPEKLIPLVILNSLEEKPLPIYGKGDNVRDWLYVEDHARALVEIMMNGSAGESYNVGGNSERTNLEVVETICRSLDEKHPRKDNKPYCDLIRFVADRPGHDRRYAIDASKIEKELNFKPSVSFEEGINKTVDWYLNNKDWWQPLREEKYSGQRLGNK